MVTEKQKQWLWFLGLWLFGFCTVGLIASIIRMIMNIGT